MCNEDKIAVYERFGKGSTTFGEAEDLAEAVLAVGERGFSSDTLVFPLVVSHFQFLSASFKFRGPN